MVFSKKELILRGSSYSYDEQINFNYSLDALLNAIVESISYIEECKDKYSREVTDLLCCIAACVDAICEYHPKIVDQNKGINWHKLIVLKKEVMLEGFIAPHRARPQIEKIKSNIDWLNLFLIHEALIDIINYDLPKLKMAFINIKENNDFRQSDPIGIYINQFLDYLYDEPLLLIIYKKLIEIDVNDIDPSAENYYCILLYRLLTIGEALNKLSSYTFSQLPCNISEKLVHVRNILCHPEREHNKLVIEDILKGNNENPALNLREIKNARKALSEAVLTLLKEYKADGSDLEGTEDPKLKKIWETIKSRNYKNTIDTNARELSNILHTPEVESIRHFLDKNQEHYDKLYYIVNNNLTYLRKNGSLTTYEKNLLRLYPHIEKRYYSILSFLENNSSGPSLASIKTQFLQEKENYDAQLQYSKKEIDKIRRKFEKLKKISTFMRRMF